MKWFGRYVVVAFLLILSSACGPTLVPAEPSTATPVEGESAATEQAVTPIPDASDATALPVEGETPVPESDALVAAVVNGEPIYLEDYERKLAQFEASLPAQGIDPNSEEGQSKIAWAREYILNVMIEQVLTKQVAIETGLDVSEEELNAYMQDMIAENGGEEAFREKLAAWGETYEDAREEVYLELIGMKMSQQVVEAVPKVAEHVHARHILVETREEAERIHAQLEAGADFAELARAYSADPNTRETGGDLGFFPRGVLTAPQIEEAAFSLQPGQFSDVVESPLGYHIVQVVERDPNREVSPENLRFLQDKALEEWVEGLWAQASVQRFVETGS